MNEKTPNRVDLSVYELHPQISCAYCNKGGNTVRWYPQVEHGSYFCDKCVACMTWREGPAIDVIVLIREEATKKVTMYRASGEYVIDNIPFGHLYIWEEGNYSDDANRALFFGAVDNAFAYKGHGTAEAYKIRMIWNDHVIYEEYTEYE